MAQVKKYLEERAERQAEEIRQTVAFMDRMGFEYDGNKLLRGQFMLDFYHPELDMVVSIMDDCPVKGQDWTVLSLKGLGIAKTHLNIVECLEDRGLLQPSGGDQ